ncbi:MAG: hypothetical protein ICV75_08775 [Nitrospiraceae bacterium]|nr:hypothetical protein [Nitrospiraceae bacterium]
MKKAQWFYGTAFVSGILIWVLVSILSGRREAWDSDLYFTLGIPVLCLVAGVLGFAEPQRPWRWGLVPVSGQCTWMLLTQGVGNLFPLGLLVFGPFAIPPVITARLGAAIARRMG